MSNFDPVHVEVNGITYNIFPFGAFKAANISTELISLIGPVIVGIFSNKDAELGEDAAISALANAFSGLTGNKVEKLIKSLILDNNVSADIDGRVEWLTKETCDFIFCRRVIDMYKLVYEVIKVNFGDFFELFSDQSGSLKQSLNKLM